MLENYIDSLRELSAMAGIEYRTFLMRMENPDNFRSYELKELDKILHFATDDLIFLIRGSG